MLAMINNTGGEILHVYEVHNRRCKNTGTRPICSIWEDDFLNLLSEKEYEKATEGGKIYFEVNKIELFNNCKTKF